MYNWLYILVISKRINNDLQIFFRSDEPYDQRFELIFDKFQIEENIFHSNFSIASKSESIREREKQ